MTTVGYGDIIPSNIVEVCFMIVSLITLCILFIYLSYKIIFFFLIIFKILYAKNKKAGVYAYSFNYIGMIV
jgi:hypothetical protein